MKDVMKIAIFYDFEREKRRARIVGYRVSQLVDR